MRKDGDMTDERLEALERLGHIQNDALHVLVDNVRALALTNAALMSILDGQDRAAVREAALAGLGQGREHERARRLIESFTREPAAAVVEHQADISAALADMPSRLQ